VNAIRKNSWLTLIYKFIFIGHGVFSKRKFKDGEFLLIYPGEEVTSKEGKKRETCYPKHYGSFLFFFEKIW